NRRAAQRSQPRGARADRRRAGLHRWTAGCRGAEGGKRRVGPGRPARHRRHTGPNHETDSRAHSRRAMRTLLAILVAAATLVAQAPQVGLIAPLPAPAPASTFDVTEKTIVQLLAAQRIGTVTSHDLVEKYLARIKAYDQDGPRLTAMVALNPKALAQADALDAERRAGRVRGPL